MKPIWSSPCKTLAQFALVVLMSLAGIAGAQAKLPDIFGEAPIIEAVNEKSVDKLNAALLDGASVHARSANGTPAIVLAVAADSLDIVKVLIENGARPDDKSKKDETSPLTLAAANGNLEIVTYLLDHKADIDEPGALRETAIIKAARAQRVEVAKLLVERGANLDETDSTGATALDIATASGSKDLIAALKKKAKSK
jgi:ankyrin repeat protein